MIDLWDILSNTMETRPDSEGQNASMLTKLSLQYDSNLSLRVFVQAIPGVGGPLDTLLSGLGAAYEKKRIADFLDELKTRLIELEQTMAIGHIEPSESLYDFVFKVFDSVRRTRSSAKHKQFANMAARQFVHERSWEEAETAATLLGDLSELQIEILLTTQNVKPCGAIGGTKRTITLADNPWGTKEGTAPPRLQDSFPNIPKSALSAACSELIARGLFHDEGLGRLDGGAVEYLTITDFADWFLAWISRDIRLSPPTLPT